MKIQFEHDWFENELRSQIKEIDQSKSSNPYIAVLANQIGYKEDLKADKKE